MTKKQERELLESLFGCVEEWAAQGYDSERFGRAFNHVMNLLKEEDEEEYYKAFRRGAGG